MVQSDSPRHAKSVCFYRTDGGREPVRDWLAGLPAASRKLIGRDIMTLQIGWPVGMPLARKIADSLWEIRSKPSHGNVRILCTIENDRIVLLHGFIKKSRKTPQQDLQLANQRLNKFRNG